MNTFIIYHMKALFTHILCNHKQTKFTLKALHWVIKCSILWIWLNLVKLEHEFCDFIKIFNFKVLINYRLKLFTTGLGIYRKFSSFLINMTCCKLKGEHKDYCNNEETLILTTFFICVPFIYDDIVGHLLSLSSKLQWEF